MSRIVILLEIGSVRGRAGMEKNMKYRTLRKGKEKELHFKSYRARLEF